ncbi:hypothetical protein GCM10022419_071130 [Nonomuraea rosea]|uniref:Outer membrane lipoprotein carrier protein LolA n=1 Tax=Nonomuraea rosea TaxID=638574 RepID=A0ABP6YB32_9ACTN
MTKSSPVGRRHEKPSMTEHELRTLLIRATEDRPAGIDLLPAPPRRRRISLPVASLGAAAALVVAVAAAVVVLLPGAQSSAQAQVVAAVENTGQESYRIHTVSGPKTFEGAFDPAQRVGVITRTGDGAETRFIGDLMYGKDPGEAKWTVAPRNDAEMAAAPPAVALVKLAPLDPQAALERLRSATGVSESGSASGPGWAGLRFAFTLEAVTGNVDVDDQGRVRRLEVTFGDGKGLVMDITGFGTAVTVETPPADQVQQAPADKPKPKKP